MKRVDIDKVFTEKVAEFIGKGYVVNSGTMAGHQGEICKVDLIKGNTLVRIWMGNDWLENFSDRIIQIHIGVITNFTTNGYTLWMKEFDEYELLTFYEVVEGKWYTDSEEEFEKIREIKKARRNYKRLDLPHYEFYRDEARREIAKKYLKRVAGYSRVSIDDIKIQNRDREYSIIYHGSFYKMH